MTLEHQRRGTDPEMSSSPTSPTSSVGKSPLVDGNTPATTSGAVAPMPIAQDIVAGAGAVHQAAKMRSQVDEWIGRTHPTHDTVATLRFMMICKALSTHQRVAELLATGQDQTVKEVVANVSSLIGGRQIIQAWDTPKQDITAHGEAWDMFVNDVDMLSEKQSNLDQYFHNCLAHDKGYGQTHEATQSFLYLIDGTEGGDEEPFEHFLALALAETTNSNIWVGGQSGSGKISDQLVRGFEHAQVKRVSLKEQEEMMWATLVTTILKVHSPGKPDWAYATVIRDNEDALFGRIVSLVKGDLNKALLDDTLDNFGA